MLITRPQPRSYMPGRAARTRRKGASTITSMMCENVSGGKSSTAATCCRPALLTTMSARTSSAATAAASERSRQTDSAPIPAADSSSRARSRSIMTTIAPAARRRSAHARPMPLAAPVTSAVCPVRSRCTVAGVGVVCMGRIVRDAWPASPAGAATHAPVRREATRRQRLPVGTGRPEHHWRRVHPAALRRPGAWGPRRGQPGRGGARARSPGSPPTRWRGHRPVVRAHRARRKRAPRRRCSPGRQP